VFGNVNLERNSIKNLKLYDAHGGDREANLMLNDLNYPHKKGAAAGPLNCGVKIGGNRFNLKYNRFIQYFLLAWTPFLLRKFRLRPFAKRGLLRAYLHSSLFLIGRGMSILNGACRHFSSSK